MFRFPILTLVKQPHLLPPCAIGLQFNLAIQVSDSSECHTSIISNYSTLMVSQHVLPSQDHQSLTPGLIHSDDALPSTMPTCQRASQTKASYGFPSIPGFLIDSPNGFPQWIPISKLLCGDVFRQTGLARRHHNGRLRGVATILPGAFTRVILKGAAPLGTMGRM